MAKRESIGRYTLIIKKLRRAPATFSQIASYLEQESELQEYDFKVSKRTFQRDLDDIRSIYDIDIRYDFSQKHYYIDFDERPQLRERILEAFDTFNALSLTERLGDYIELDKRRPIGTEHLYGLIHAVKNRLLAGFTYQTFYQEEASQRTVEPYLLKEFKNRWYVVALDRKDGKIKTFALDRMKDLDISKGKFEAMEGFDAKEYFRHCFGINSPNDQKPQLVELSFDPFQGRYVKSLPLHSSQQIIRDDENELRLRLTVFLTHDFLMEVLSYGHMVKVIRPKAFADEVAEILTQAAGQYKENQR